MKVWLTCKDGVTQGFHVHPRNLPKLRKKYNRRLIMRQAKKEEHKELARARRKKTNHNIKQIQAQNQLDHEQSLDKLHE